MDRATGSPSLPRVICDVPHTEVSVVTFSWCPGWGAGLLGSLCCGCPSLLWGLHLLWGTPEAKEAQQNSMHTVKPLFLKLLHTGFLSLWQAGATL